MATIIANRKSSVIENLHVVMGFIRAVCPADNVLSREQGKFLAGMVNDAIEELEANKKRTDHLEEYKAGWLSVINACNEAYPHWTPFKESEFLRLADLIKAIAIDPVGFHARDQILGDDNGEFRKRYIKHGSCHRVLFVHNKDAQPINLRQTIAIQALNALIISGLNSGAWEDYEDLVKSANTIADEFLKGSQGGAV